MSRSSPAVPRAVDCSTRVAVVARLSQPGGVQSVVLSLIKGLNERGIIPDIVWDSPPNREMLEEKGVQAGYMPVRFTLPSSFVEQAPITLKYTFRIANLFTSSQVPRAYNFYYIFYNGFLVDDGTPHVRYLSGPPLLPQLDAVSPGLRGLPYRAIRALYRRYLKNRFPVYEYHRDSPYVINAQYTADLFEEAHGVRLPVINPPIDLSGRSFSDHDIHRRDTITYFSRFIDYKRPEMVLSLAERFPGQRVLLMGGVKPENRAYYQQLRDLARQKKLANAVFLDNPNDQRVKEELSRTRFYVFPGVNEHFGMATAEAIGSGAVPYVHDSGGQREIVPDPDLRFTDDEFIEKFARLVALSSEELNDIRKRLAAHVQQFSEAVFIEKMLAFMSRSQESEFEENELQAVSA